MRVMIIFGVGAAASVLSEIFWRGGSRWSMALWGGAGMLLLRRIVLRFPFESRALLCLFGAMLLVVLRLTLHIIQDLLVRTDAAGERRGIADIPSFSYVLYRFLLIAPAYAIIEYLEARFGI